MNRSDLSSMDSYSLLCVVIHSSNNDVENSPCSMTRSPLELLPTSTPAAATSSGLGLGLEKDAPTRMADAKRARRSIVDFIMIDTAVNESEYNMEALKRTRILRRRSPRTKCQLLPLNGCLVFCHLTNTLSLCVDGLDTDVAVR